MLFGTKIYIQFLNLEKENVRAQRNGAAFTGLNSNGISPVQEKFMQELDKNMALLTVVVSTILFSS